ncbi:MAG: hypothetical protein KDA92_14885 [Planctomycetales bacterium]|nr:hypothetical protein [Planctomycetales bacterium]MCA9168035.1 hypothetical protein [Planctomycetales bacterium]
MIRSASLLLCFLFMGSSLADANAQQCCHCGKHGQECHLVKKTIMVPTVITETRVKSCVVEKEVEREETYTVFKQVPVKKQYKKECCYLADEVKTKTITQTQCHRVQNPVSRTMAVKVPVEECYEGTRLQRVCDECGREVCVETPCMCKKTTLEKDFRSDCVSVEDVVFEKTTKQIDYCVKTPKKHTELCSEEITYTLEPVQKTRKVVVCVPEIVKQTYDVRVTKMLPKTIYCCEACCTHHHH